MLSKENTIIKWKLICTTAEIHIQMNLHRLNRRMEVTEERVYELEDQSIEMEFIPCIKPKG